MRGPREEVLGTFLSGNERAVFAFVGMSLELSSPKLFTANGPRIFGHVDSALSFDSDRPIAGEGNPGPITYPTTPSGTPLDLAPVSGMLGQGTSLHSEAKPLVLSAGAGLSFEFEALGRTLRLKPSVEYLWQETSVTAEAGYLVSTQVVNGADLCSRAANDRLPPDFPPGPEPCASAFLSASRTKAFHSLGPGLEIEMDAGRMGPVTFALYASGQAYRMLGSAEIDLDLSESLDIPAGFNPVYAGGCPQTGSCAIVSSGSLPAGTQDPVSLSGTVELEPWHYRFGVGLRFRWLPK